MSVIALDATAGGNNNSNVLTYPHTCTGSNIILFLAIEVNGNLYGSITSVTYNGIAMTQINTKNTADNQLIFLYYLIAPATGANNISISISGTTVIRGSSVSYTGANQTGVPDASTVNSGASVTSLATSVTTVLDNCWTVLAAVSNSGALSASTGSTLRNSQNGSGGIFDSNGIIHPAGSKSMSVLDSGGAANLATVMASFAPFITTNTRNQSDSISVGASRVATIAKIYSATRAISVSISVGASRVANLAKGVTRNLSDSIMNGASRFVTFLVQTALWLRNTKHTSTFANNAKDSSIWTDDVKSNSNFITKQKS